MRRVVGVDIGGTKIAGALVDGQGRTGAMATVPTPATTGAEAVVDAVAGLVRDLVGDVTTATLDAVGVGTAGVVDVGSGRVLSATDHITGWVGVELGTELGARLGVPVAVCNDVHAHAAGEAWCGAAADTASALVVAAGTGVGGAWVRDGVVHAGARGAAGHVGHVPAVEAAGVACPCGGSGHVEAVASGPGLSQLYRRMGGDAAEQARDVVDRARAGDVLALEAVERSATALGRTLGGLANVLDPDVVIVTGGLSGAGDIWWHALRQAVAGELVPTLSGLTVRPGVLGGRAGVIGAASLVHDQAGRVS